MAGQIFEVVKFIGRYHSLSAGLLIGGRKDVDEEKERVNSLNILVCTPGRLLQHMDETPNFECSQLQVSTEEAVYFQSEQCNPKHVHITLLSYDLFLDHGTGLGFG